MVLDYTKTSEKQFDDVVSGVEKTTAERGFRVLHIHNVKATLEEKGFERGPFKIIEICNAKFAHKALGINEDVALFMPCKINVYTKDGKTVLSAARPKVISEFFSEPGLKELADEVDGIVRSIVDEVC
ncbi:MAG: DUF302 domain-containing protein [candidate division Zixibacteria bacterium]